MGKEILPQLIFALTKCNVKMCCIDKIITYKRKNVARNKLQHCLFTCMYMYAFTSMHACLGGVLNLSGVQP